VLSDAFINFLGWKEDQPFNTFLLFRESAIHPGPFNIAIGLLHRLVCLIV